MSFMKVFEDNDNTIIICVLIPLSGWGASMIGYLTSAGVDSTIATDILIKSIPLNFYCIISVFSVLFFAFTGKDFGLMKKAEKRALETGLLDEPKNNKVESLVEVEVVALSNGKTSSAMNLIIQILTLIGVIVTVLLETGQYLANLLSGFLTPTLLPALVFIMACLISFSTGTSLGTMAITMVIDIPMATTMGASIPLVASDVFEGSIFGDHSTPISDTTIMTCSTTGCDVIDHIKTQLPYTLSFAAISIVLHIVAGLIM